MKRSRLIGAAAFALVASLAGTASAQVCVALNGYKQDVGTYGAVVGAGHDAFLSRRMVPDCEVKEVLESLKGKPAQTTVFFGPMTQDECSLYRALSSIDAKLRQGKLTDAYTTNAALIAKVGSIQITAAAQQSIATAATATAACITAALQ